MTKLFVSRRKEEKPMYRELVLDTTAERETLKETAHRFATKVLRPAAAAA